MYLLVHSLPQASRACPEQKILTEHVTGTPVLTRILTGFLCFVLTTPLTSYEEIWVRLGVERRSVRVAHEHLHNDA